MFALADTCTFNGRELSASERATMQRELNKVLAPFHEKDDSRPSDQVVHGVKQGSPDFDAMVKAAVQHPIVVGEPKPSTENNGKTTQ